MACALGLVMLLQGAPAWAVITTTSFYTGARAITLRIGSTAGTDTVQFNVQGNAGNSLPYASPTSGSGTSVAASNAGGVTFRVLMQQPFILFVLSQQMTTTVSNPASLTCTGGNCAGYSIPFSSIRWSVTGSSSSSDLQNGVFLSGGGTQTLLNYNLGTLLWGSTVEFLNTMNFSYDNTTAYPAGTYTGTVTYTSTMP